MLALAAIIFLISWLTAQILLLPIVFAEGIHIPAWVGLAIVLAIVAWCLGD